MTVNTPSINTPDGSNSGTNAGQEHNAIDVLRDASFLSDFGALASQASQASQTYQNSRAGTNTVLEFSPIGNQVASPVGSDVTSGINLNTPPRQNSPRDNVAVTGMDLLNTPNTTASNDGVVGTLIPAPSPRRSTQSPETHQLQQTLRNNANEQALRYDSASPTNSNNSGNAMSAFSVFGANSHPITVETVQENSDDGNGWPEGDKLAENAAGDNAQVNSAPSASAPSASKTDNKAGVAYDSTIANGVDSASSHTVGNLVINTSDPGRGDFVIRVGALGNASGTPLDGSHNFSFGERAVDKQDTIEGDKQPKEHKGMLMYSGSESSASYNTPTGFDPSDPEVIGDLLSRPPKPINHSPTSTIKFNEQTVVTEYAQGGAASTKVGNLGGANDTRPSSSLPGSAALRQHNLTGGNANGGSLSPNRNPNGNPDSGNSNGNNGSGDQGSTSGGNDPQDSGPDPHDLNKIALHFRTMGGPLEHWGMQGVIRVEELVRFSRIQNPQTYQWELQTKRQLIRPEIVDRVADRMHCLHQHDDDNRVQAIVDGMPLFVLTVPNARMDARGTTLLGDNLESTQAMCRILGRHLAFANTLPPD